MTRNSHVARELAQKSDRRPRVMLFTDSFVHGGTERQLVAALRHLERSRFDVRVGCLKRRGPFLTDVEALGVPVVEFAAPVPGSGALGWLAGKLRRIRDIAAYLHEQEIDLLHAFDFYGNAFAVPAARRAGVAVVLASRRELAGDRGFIQRMAIRYACHRAHGIVANSRAAGSRLTALIGNAEEKVTVIHNGIELSAFRPQRGRAEVRAEFGLNGDAVWMGILAALRPEKQIDTFLRAAVHVARELPEARFLLIGDGSERARLEALAGELGITERTTFAGDRRDVPDLLGALDVFVLSSVTESFPNAILEAMAAGLPVVASRVGGIAEVVEDGVTGYLTPVGDHGAMAVRILELARDAEQRRGLGAAGRARVEREFTPQEMARRLEELYERMLLRRHPAARILQIGNYPPPVCGWALHTQLVDRSLAAREADSRVMDIGPGRRVAGRGCIPVHGSFDYAGKLVKYRARGFTFHMHVNGDSWKGYMLALAAVLLGRVTGKPAVLTFHAGPSQIYFPRRSGLWYGAFRLLFRACGEIICNHEPVKRLIEGYGVPAENVHAIPAYSTQYREELPVPVPAAVEQFLASHQPRLFSYALFRPEFTIEVLLEAFAGIRAKYPHAGLLLGGPREVPPEAKEQMRRLGIAEAVLIPGNLPHAEFLTAVQRSDMFVRTHLRDGVCTSVLEALALGVPVVAFDDGLRPPSVVTYAPAQAGPLAAAVERVLADLRAARAAVRAPGVDNHLAQEVELLLAAGAARQFPASRVAEGT